MSLPNHNDAQSIIPEHVAFQVLDGQAVVLNLDSGRHFGFNEVGTLFWQGVEQGQTLETITEGLLERYDVDRAELQQDLAELMTALKQRILIEERSELSA
jgi:hypothetical protein